jgi:hypothetical protein
MEDNDVENHWAFDPAVFCFFQISVFPRSWTHSKDFPGSFKGRRPKHRSYLLAIRDWLIEQVCQMENIHQVSWQTFTRTRRDGTSQDPNLKDTMSRLKFQNTGRERVMMTRNVQRHGDFVCNTRTTVLLHLLTCRFAIEWISYPILNAFGYSSARTCC